MFFLFVQKQIVSLIINLRYSTASDTFKFLRFSHSLQILRRHISKKEDLKHHEGELRLLNALLNCKIVVQVLRPEYSERVCKLEFSLGTFLPITFTTTFQHLGQNIQASFNTLIAALEKVLKTAISNLKQHELPPSGYLQNRQNHLHKIMLSCRSLKIDRGVFHCSTCISH